MLIQLYFFLYLLCFRYLIVVCAFWIRLCYWVFSPILQATKALSESRDIALLCFWTSALEGGEGSASRPGRFLLPGKTRYPLYRRVSGPQGRSGQVRKISPPPGFDPRTVQPVDSRYTVWATQPLRLLCQNINNKKIIYFYICLYIYLQTPG
jgi:hypothetical protein